MTRADRNHDPKEFVGSLVKYGFTGALTIGMQAVVFVALAEVLGLSGVTSYTIAVAISVVIGYIGQSRWAFAHRKAGSAPRYLMVAGISFTLGTAATWLIVDHARLPAVWALPVTIGLVPFLSFLMLRAWVFPGRTPGERAGPL